MRDQYTVNIKGREIRQAAGFSVRNVLIKYLLLTGDSWLFTQSSMGAGVGFSSHDDACALSHPCAHSIAQICVHGPTSTCLFLACYWFQYYRDSYAHS